MSPDELELLTDRPNPDGWRFRVLRWERFEAELFVPERVEPRRVTVLRLHVPPADKPEGPPYWDITAQQLVATLEPLLPLVAAGELYLHLSRGGTGVKAVYSVQVGAG